MSIGERMKQRRKELRMSAEALGKKIGKDRATVYRYEQGFIENLPLDVLEPIAQALQTTPQYLMGWEEMQKKNDALLDIVFQLKADEELFDIVKKITKLDTAEKRQAVKSVLHAFEATDK